MRSSTTVTTTTIFWDMTACSPLFRRHLLAASILEVRQNLEHITPPNRQLLSTILHGVTFRKSVNFTDAISNNRDTTAVGHFSFFQFYQTTFWTQIQFPSYGAVLLLLSWGTACLSSFNTVNSERPISAIVTLSQRTKCEPAGQKSSCTANCKAGTALSAVTTLWAGWPGVRNPPCG